MASPLLFTTFGDDKLTTVNLEGILTPELISGFNVVPFGIADNVTVPRKDSSPVTLVESAMRVPIPAVLDSDENVKVLITYPPNT